MKTTILIVDDEPAMIMGLQDNLEMEGYRVETAGNGLEALQAITQNRYDLVLLDVMMPKMSGFEVCKKIRKDGNRTPVILLTARGTEMDRVLGLEIGADDYITKPFSLREQLARIKAVLRRTSDAGSDGPDGNGMHVIGELTVDTARYEGWKNGDKVALSHKEVEILRYLIRQNGKTVTRDDLLREVWGYDETPTTRTVDNFILKLRKTIEPDPSNPRHLITVHGAGYKLIR